MPLTSSLTRTRGGGSRLPRTYPNDKWPFGFRIEESKTRKLSPSSKILSPDVGQVGHKEFKCFSLSPKDLWKDLNMYLIPPTSLPLMANFVNCFSFSPLSGSKTFAPHPDFVVLFLLVYYWFCSFLGLFFDVFNVLFLPPGQYKGLEVFLNNPPQMNFRSAILILGFNFFKITLYACF